MPDIIFPVTSSPGVRPQESAGRLINAFVEKTSPGAPSGIITRRSPGLSRFTIVNGQTHTRGFQDAGSVALWILDDRIQKVANDGTVSDLGALTGTDYVTTARNNAATPDMVAVTSVGCFNIFDSSPPTAFADADLPASPTSVCDFDGYFVWSFGDGRIFTSDLNSVNVNAASFTTEQGMSVRRVVRYAGRLYAFGDRWTGVYRDAGTQPFPLAREVTIPRGIVGTHAIAGWEIGWANQLIWVGDDFVVYQLNGYTPQPISSSDVSRDIKDAVLAGDRDQLVAFVYMFEGNAFWVLTCADRFTWEYNSTTGSWDERQSYQRDFWRGIKSLRLFDQWLIGDQLSGELFAVDGNYFLEGTDFLIWEVVSGAMVNFPRTISVARASFHMTSGVGTFPSVDNPQVEISWSLDGGHTYQEPVLRRLGGPGETKSHPYVLSCGLTRAQGIRYKLRVSDAAHVRLFGGSLESELRGFAG